MLELEQVDLAYATLQVVQGVSLRLGAGELACLLGPSGCGKSTLLRAIAGLHPVMGGHIRLRGQIVDDGRTRMPTERRGIGVVFQDLALFPHLNVQRHLELALHTWAPADRAPRIAQLLADFGLQEHARRKPHELSGGQQQRVAVARALAARTDLVLLDEPFSSLDARLRTDMNRWLRRQLKRDGVSALMVSHDQAEALVFADSVGVMERGRLLQWDAPQTIYQHPHHPAVARFLGEGRMLPLHPQADGRYASALGILADAPVPPQGQLLVRPEDVVLDPSGVPATVSQVEFRGACTWLLLQLDETPVELWMQHPQPLAEGSRIRVALRADHAAVVLRT